MHRLFAIFWLGLFLTPAYAQPTLWDTLSPAQQQEDWQTFREALEHAHGGLYWYLDSGRWDSVEQTQSRRGWKPKSLLDFSLFLRQELTQVHCGHTWMTDPNGWNEYQRDSAVYLPFSIHFSAPGVGVISKDYTPDQHLPLGAQVTHLDGLPLHQVWNRLSAYTTADGYSEGGLMARMRWSYIPYYAQHFQLPHVVLTYEWAGQSETIMLECLSGELRTQRYNERYAADAPPTRPFFSFDTVDHNGQQVGYLYLKTFSSDWLKNEGISIKKKFRETFDAIAEQELDYLILDLRDNSGGDDALGALLCQYLVPDSFQYFTHMRTRTRRFGRTPGLVKDEGLRVMGKLTFRDRDLPGTYRWIWSKTLREQKPQAAGFHGNLVVLHNGGTYSTATDVVSALYTHRSENTTFVGQETGGGYHGNTSAAWCKVVLPNSGLEISIPAVRYTNPGAKPEWYGRGVIPEVPVMNTFEDLQNHHDRMLEVALETVTQQ